MHNIKDSSENYLETIYRISKNQEVVRSIDIVRFLEVSKPSVSVGMKKLKEEKLIDISEEGVITLLEDGEKIAKEVYAKHVLIRDFLIKIGVKTSLADDDACKIEHVISRESFEKLKEFTNKIEHQCSFVFENPKV